MSQYDSNYYSGGGGGGYLQGGSPFSQGGSPGGMRKTEVSNSLRPFTVSQLNQATQAHTDAEWRVDDVEIGQVTIVGHVVSIQKQTTNSVYMLDDGTGRMEARHWVDSASDDDSHKWAAIEEMRYVRVTGTLKSFGKKRYINATHIRNITDSHEIYFHILEAITANLIIERGPPSNPGSGTAAKTERVGGGLSAYSAQNNSSTANDQFAHLPPLQCSIMKFLMNQPPQDEGIHVAAIAKAIAGTHDDANKICVALDKLMDQGHVFTTIDDSHFSLSL